MAMRIEFGGVAELRALARKLEQQGAKGLTAEIEAGILEGLKPVTSSALPASARATLPKSGGLADLVASTPYETKSKSRGRKARVLLVGLSRSTLRRMDRGVVRHPVFGDRERWVNQPVKGLWFTRPTQASEPAIRAKVTKAIDEALHRLERGA